MTISNFCYALLILHLLFTVLLNCVQVVGKKRVFLIDPKWSENVYPYDDFLLFNTAQVDLENIDYEKFPKFENTEIFECILEAGETWLRQLHTVLYYM